VAFRIATHSAWSDVGGADARLRVTETSSPEANGRGVTSKGSETPEMTFSPPPFPSPSPSRSPSPASSTISVSLRATRHEPTLSGLVSRVARIVVVSLDRSTWPPVTVVAPSSAIRVSSSESRTGPSTVHFATYVPLHFSSTATPAVTTAIPPLVSRAGCTSRSKLLL
jgi:hypothetical protein